MYDRTIVVNGGGTNAVNGGALRQAALFAAGQNPTASDPWLIKLEPGTFDLGTSSLSLEPHVNLDGAGRGVSMITSRLASSSTNNDGTIRLWDNNRISNLSITNSAATTTLIAPGILVYNGAVIDNVDITVETSRTVRGVYLRPGAQIQVIDSHIDVHGFANSVGIDGGNSESISIDNSDIVATGPSSIGVDGVNAQLAIANTSVLSELPVDAGSSGNGNAGGLTVRYSELEAQGANSVAVNQFGSSTAIADFRFTTVTESIDIGFGVSATCRLMVGPSGSNMDDCP